MQPYFLPYIGYFQLIAAVDIFVVYDNIKYTKRGWINRNKMLVKGSDKIFSIPLKKDSDSLDIVQRELAENFDRRKLLNQFKESYKHAPNYEQVFPTLEQIIINEDTNLFAYLNYSISRICELLGIDTEIVVSSGLNIDHSLKGKNKVLALCKALKAETYINTIGGIDLYDKEQFAKERIDLRFINTLPLEYSQSSDKFTPCLSIVDVLMFNTLDQIETDYLKRFELL